MIWLRYHTVLALCDRPVLAMVNILALELWQLLQYSYVCSSVMSIHLEGGASTRDARVLLANVDMVSRLVNTTTEQAFGIGHLSRTKECFSAGSNG